MKFFVMCCNTDKMALKTSPKSCNINKTFIPYKILYFLLCSAHVGVIPYLPVFAKRSLKLSATTVGMLTTCMQFSTTISKPVVGVIADYLDKIKCIFVVLTCFEVMLNFSMLSLTRLNPTSIQTRDSSTGAIEPLDVGSITLRMSPARIYDASASTHFRLQSTWEMKNEMFKTLSPKNRNYSSVQLNDETSINSKKIRESSRSNEKRLSTITDQRQKLNLKNTSKCYMKCLNSKSQVKCNINATVCTDTENIQCRLNRNEKSYTFCGNSHNVKKFTVNFSLSTTTNDTSRNKGMEIVLHRISYHSRNFNKIIHISCNDSSEACTLHCEKTLNLCQSQHKANSNATIQFWIYAVCAILSAMCQGSLFTLSDTACFASLKDTAGDFGKQRFWGAIGWGAMAPLAGFLNDLSSEAYKQSDYSPGFYIMGIMSAFFLLNILFMKNEKHTRSSKSSSNLKTVLCTKDFIFMQFFVFLAGFLTAFSAFFVMWHLDSLGSSRLLMGLALAVECLLGEAPFMFFSGWIIGKIGHRNVLTLSFLAFSARFTGYYLLQNVWFVLPIELLNGLTYGLFYPTMTSYAKLISPAGSEATIQGVLGGTFQGLGTGIGSLVAGIAFDRFGGRKSFFLAAVISAIAAVLNFLLCLFRHYKQREPTVKEPV